MIINIFIDYKLCIRIKLIKKHILTEESKGLLILLSEIFLIILIVLRILSGSLVPNIFYKCEIAQYLLHNPYHKHFDQIRSRQ